MLMITSPFTTMFGKSHLLQICIKSPLQVRYAYVMFVYLQMNDLKEQKREAEVRGETAEEKVPSPYYLSAWLCKTYYFTQTTNLQQTTLKTSMSKYGKFL